MLVWWAKLSISRSERRGGGYCDLYGHHPLILYGTYSISAFADKRLGNFMGVYRYYIKRQCPISGIPVICHPMIELKKMVTITWKWIEGTKCKDRVWWSKLLSKDLIQKHCHSLSSDGYFSIGEGVGDGDCSNNVGVGEGTMGWDTLKENAQETEREIEKERMQ